MALKIRKGGGGSSGRGSGILPTSQDDISYNRSRDNSGSIIAKLFVLLVLIGGGLYAGFTAYKGVVFFRSPESALSSIPNNSIPDAGIAANPILSVSEVKVQEGKVAAAAVTSTVNPYTGTESRLAPPPQQVSPATTAVEPSLLAPAPVGCLSTYPELDTGKHIVPPPEGAMTLVCCETTKGPLNIAVHPAWAPVGAKNFLNMVETKFFSSKVGLFRALKGFLVQFGLAGDPHVQTGYESTMGGKGNLVDDPPWLPLGPPGREINGIKRFPKGYMAYAGAGPNSRGTQLIMSFEDNKYLAGGSPWEVPFGQLVGEQSFHTLDNIYTGYGEKPSQGKIRNRGVKYLEEEFPLIDYITSCQVTARDVPWKYVHPYPISDISHSITKATTLRE